MRNLLKAILIPHLLFLASSVVRKYKPTIVMVTGSVGKTSTKSAVAAALAEKFYLRASEKGYNTEIGMPLTILNVNNPWSNPLSWLKVFAEGWALLLFPNHYPKMLVLEVGADQPGDLIRILRVAKPNAVVVTLLPEIPVHVEAYATPEAVREEEFRPAMALPAGAPLILNTEDHHAFDHATRTNARVCTFGMDAKADVQITSTAVWLEAGKPIGMQADLVVNEKSYPLKVRGSFGQSQFYAPAAAVATSLAFGMTPDEAFKGLESYTPPPGRGRLFAGIKNTLIIDDSYNASPVAVAAALASLALLPKTSRKVAILGDMLELGRYSQEEHRKIGELAGTSVDFLITVGARADTIGEAAIQAGLSADKVHHFADSIEAAKAVPNMLQEGDTVLCKGSQTGVRLERIVKVLLAHPEDAAELVRQSAEWQSR